MDAEDVPLLSSDEAMEISEGLALLRKRGKVNKSSSGELSEDRPRPKNKRQSKGQIGGWPDGPQLVDKDVAPDEPQGQVGGDDNGNRGWGQAPPPDRRVEPMEIDSSSGASDEDDSDANIPTDEELYKWEKGRKRRYKDHSSASNVSQSEEEAGAKAAPKVPRIDETVVKRKRGRPPKAPDDSPSKVNRPMPKILENRPEPNKLFSSARDGTKVKEHAVLFTTTSTDSRTGIVKAVKYIHNLKRLDEVRRDLSLGTTGFVNDKERCVLLSALKESVNDIVKM